ncbi:unnamed protein product [Hermetia illucens]|uniref:dolichol kinase n=1 Tax=Hermetia illucens TaxID=343691 RepID=A0A7R8YXA8_HERIL|nr:dolichol kinase [Hermetia illucens]CAD7087707.1 unnamed protein product [Hermetia illucens]
MRRAGIDQSTKRSRIKMTSSPDKETEVQTSDQDPKSVKGLIDSQYETRVNASSGYWLCILLPFAFIINNIRYPKSSSAFDYKMTTIVSFGLCLQSIYIFTCILESRSKLLRICLISIPGICTSLFIQIILNQTTAVSVIWGLTTTLTYNYVYFKLLKTLPRSFTYGEASVAAQGLILFLMNGFLRIPHFVNNPPMTYMGQMNAIMITALSCLIVTLVLLYILKPLRNPVAFYPLMVALAVAVCTVPVTRQVPVVTLWNFIVSDLRRVAIIVFYIGLVGATIAAVNWRLQKDEKASTAVRKLFHLLVVFVYIPGLLYQCTFLYIASGVALAVMTVIETVRVIKVPPLYEALEKSFDVFADEKDCGNIALTPFYLLIGCSLPMWISPHACVTIDNALHNVILLMAGVLTVGIGDTAASTIGLAFGKHKLPNSTKSVEGTIANMVAQTLAVFLLVHFGYIHLNPISKLTTGFAIIFSSLIEAFTDQVDNLVLPLIFYITCIIT